MNVNFSNFSSVLSDVTNLSGVSTVNTSKVNELSGTLGNLSVDFNNLSNVVSQNTSNVNYVSGVAVQNTLNITTVSGVTNQNSVNISNLSFSLSQTNSNVSNNTNTINTLSNTLYTSNYGAVLSSNNSGTVWSYERYVRYDVTVPSGANCYYFGNVPLNEVTFHLDYDNTYYFDTTQTSGTYNFTLSSTPYNSGTSEVQQYVTGTGSYTLLKLPRSYCKPLYVLDSNDSNFGGVDYNKPYLSYNNYTTISGTRNVRNRDQLLCLGDTTLYLPQGVEGYKFTFNVLSGTVLYYTVGYDTVHDGSTSGVLTEGGAVAFYTNNNWFIR